MDLLPSTHPNIHEAPKDSKAEEMTLRHITASWPVFLSVPIGQYQPNPLEVWNEVP